jgi:hypothetical protein
MNVPRRFLVFTLSACALLSIQAADTKSDAGWRNLPLIKDGKTSPDWVQIGYGHMAVESDTLRTEPAPQGLGLFTYRKERFGNCQIRVVFKAKDERANAGIYVRIADGILNQVNKPGASFDRDASGKISDPSMEKAKAAAEREEGPWYAVHNGYEVQIAGGGDELHRTGAIYSLAKSTSVPKPGEWQTMLVTLDGTKISVELDGKAVSTLDTASKDLPARKQWHEPKRENKRPEIGYIGLQTHDPGDVVWFKEVSVRPLRK